LLHAAEDIPYQLESQYPLTAATDKPRKMGRPEKELSKNSLGGRIRAERERRKLTTTALGNYLGVTNQQISIAEQQLASVPTGTYKPGLLKGRRVSDQLVYAIAQELGQHFDEPVLRDFLREWLVRVRSTWGMEFTEQGQKLQSEFETGPQKRKVS
jgi:transcriptional regulator with XRE-family HTH domain